MPAPTITSLPAAPNRTTDSANFVPKADAFVAALPTFGNELNALGSWMNTTAASVATTAAGVTSAANSLPFSTWTALTAATGMSAGDRAQVMAADTGTHTDPVVGGTVSNSGNYQYFTSPAGWKRISNLDSTDAAASAAAAAAAAAGAGGSAAITAFNDLTNHGPNLFDPANSVTGYVNTANGALVVAATYLTSNYMPVKAGNQYVTNHNAPSGTGYAWYDSSKTFLSGANGTAAGTAYTAPTNAAYLRMTVRTDGSGNVSFGGNPLYSWMVVEGTTLPTAFREFGYADPSQAMAIARAAGISAMSAKPLLLDRNAITTSTLLDNTGGTSALSSYFMTGYIPVQDGDYICANTSFVAGSSGYGWVWYDRNKNKIGGVGVSCTATTTSGSNTINVTAFGTNGALCVGMPISGTGIPAGAYITAIPAAGLHATGSYTISANATASGSVTVTGGGILAGVPFKVPPGAAYARSSFPTAALNTLELSNQALPTNGDVPGYVGWSDVQAQRHWLGKNLCTLGDSIMAGLTASLRQEQALTTRLRANGSIWGAKSGRSTSQLLDGSDIAGGGRGPSGAYVSSDFASIDLVFSNCGTNDFGYVSGAAFNAPYGLGTLGDTAANNTFYGYLYDIYINKLQTWNPAMRIALATPLPRFDNSATGNPTNSSGVTLQQYADAVIAFGQKWSIPVLDLFRLSGLNNVNKATLTSDNLHINDTMQARIVRMTADWLDTL